MENKMKQGFDEWYSDARDITAEAGWKAGAQSRQAEIDGLQKRIDEAMEILEYNEYVDSPSQALDILKGQNND